MFIVCLNGHVIWIGRVIPATIRIYPVSLYFLLSLERVHARYVFGIHDKTRQYQTSEVLKVFIFFICYKYALDLRV